MGLIFKKVTREILLSEIDDFIAISYGTPHDNWHRNNYLLNLEGKWDYSLAAYVKNYLAGYVIVSLKDKNTLHIHRFIVNSDMRGRGIGKAILDKLTKTVGTQFTKLTLKVYNDNPAALVFYKKNGFKISDTKADLYLMKKSLL